MGAFTSDTQCWVAINTALTVADAVENVDASKPASCIRRARVVEHRKLCTQLLPALDHWSMEQKRNMVGDVNNSESVYTTSARKRMETWQRSLKHRRVSKYDTSVVGSDRKTTKNRTWQNGKQIQKPERKWKNMWKHLKT